MKGGSSLFLLWACFIATIGTVAADHVSKGVPARGTRGLKKGGNKGGGSMSSSSSEDEEAVGMVRVESMFDMDTTYTNLLNALNGIPAIKVVAEINHAAAAASVGLTLSPNRLVVFGNPFLGTPLMEADLLVGLDLPQKMLVWEDDGKVFCGFNPPEYLSARYDVTGVATLATIGGALKNLASAATGVDAADIGEDGGSSSSSSSDDGMIMGGYTAIPSAFDFDTTLAKLVAAIENAPPSIAFQVDHAANAANSGAGVLRPNTLIVFGSPVIGTPLMVASPTTGIDLPLKFLVTQDASGGVSVVANSIYFLQDRHNLPDSGTLDTIDNVLANLIKASTE